jgi:hypothetical protein
MIPAMRLRKRLLVLCLAAGLAAEPPLVLAGTTGPRDAPRLRAHPPRSTSSAFPKSLFGEKQDDFGTFVTNCNDSGLGSLRQVIQDAPYNGRINLKGLSCSTITLGSAIEVNANGLVIVGPGPDRLAIDGNGTTQLFDVHAPFVAFARLRLQNGYSQYEGGCIASTGTVYLGYAEVMGCHVHNPSGGVRGGAIFAAGEVELQHSVITSNLAEASGATNALGGAIFAGTGLTAGHSTIDSNEARSIKYSTGGAAYVVGHSHYDLANNIYDTTISNNTANNVGGISFVGGGVYLLMSTISGNVAHGFVGGIYASSVSQIRNSTIAFNCAAASEVGPNYRAAVGFEAYQAGIDAYSSIVSNNTLCPPGAGAQGAGVADDIGFYGEGFIHGDHNLVVNSTVSLPPDTIRQDPLLGPLAANGASLWTHALLPGSPAIDAGYVAFHGGTDERGGFFPRLMGTSEDIGAYENQTEGTVFVATSCDDSGPGTLRDLAAGASSGDVIDLSELACSRITLTSGAIPIPQVELRIKGPGSDQLALDGNGNSGVLFQNADGLLRIEGLAFENGYFYNGLAGGSCVWSAGSVIGRGTRFEHCIAHGYSACQGGAVFARGDAMFSDSHFTKNSCIGGSNYARGGAIEVWGHLKLDNSTMAGNSAMDDGSSEVRGGGFFALKQADIAFSTISGNHARVAGAGYAYSLAVTQSTVSGNAADLQIGGISTYMGGVYNSTVAFNTTAAGGSEGAGFFATVRGDIESSIFFGNTFDTDAYDIGSSVGLFFGADNLVGASPWSMPVGTITEDPVLGPLQDNGGPTLTHALGTGSPALDAGNNGLGFDTDQRGAGHPRVIGAEADIGAVEMGANAADLVFRDGFDTPSL